MNCLFRGNEENSFKRRRKSFSLVLKNSLSTRTILWDESRTCSRFYRYNSVFSQFTHLRNDGHTDSPSHPPIKIEFSDSLNLQYVPLLFGHHCGDVSDVLLYNARRNRSVASLRWAMVSMPRVFHLRHLLCHILFLRSPGDLSPIQRGLLPEEIVANISRVHHRCRDEMDFRLSFDFAESSLR